MGPCEEAVLKGERPKKNPGKCKVSPNEGCVAKSSEEGRHLSGEVADVHVP